MVYELYTIPSCKVCSEVKSNLDGRDVGYEEFNFAGLGRKRFAEVYKKFKGNLRNEKGAVDFPILVKRNDSKIELIAQGKEIKNKPL